MTTIIVPAANQPTFDAIAKPGMEPVTITTPPPLPVAALERPSRPLLPIWPSWEERMCLPDPLPVIKKKETPMGRTDWECLFEITWPGYRAHKDQITPEQITEHMRQLVKWHAESTAAVESAWGIIANASGGNWSLQNDEWTEAAARWRDLYIGSAIKIRLGDSPALPKLPPQSAPD